MILFVVTCLSTFLLESVALFGYFQLRYDGALFLHVVGTLLALFGMARYLKRNVYDWPQLKRLLPLLALLTLLIPYGSVGLSLCVVLGFRLPRVKKKDPIQLISQPPLPFKPLDLDSGITFADGGLYDILRHSPDVDKRLTAVTAATRMRNSDAVPILKLAMRDAIDDVRLLAYSVKDKIENRITADIRETQAELANSRDQERPDLHRILAFSSWEMVYLDLVEGSLRDYMIGQTIEHAEACIALKPEGAVTMLLGRAQLARGDLDAAEQAFTACLERGLQAPTLAPYFAELAYLRADFAGVQKHLASLPVEQRERSALRDICKQWVPA